MTLYRQLLIFTLTLFLTLFASLWIEKLQSTRSFLVRQMQSHAQDTATSLGLSLSPIMAENDLATAGSMIDAVFDRGYYKTIALRNVKDEILTERTLRVEIEGVPDWFVDLIVINSPRAQALVMSGWNHAGKLFVESHPGYAYQTLWKTMVRMSIYFLLAVSIVIVLGGVGLRILLEPLKRVEQQAEAICRKEYNIQTTLPKTRELRQVVDSMNRMTAQVRDMFTSQAKVAKRLRRNAYSDPLTGLGNRRYLTAQVEAHLESAKKDAGGALLMLQLHDLKKINETEGFTAGDALLKTVAGIIRKETRAQNDTAIVRLGGGDFAIYASGVNSADAYDITEILTRKLSRLAVENSYYSENFVHIGGVYYDKACPLPQLLSEADNALQAARRAGPNQWSITLLPSQDQTAIKGRTWWKEALEEVLEKDEILLFKQPVKNSNNPEQVLHHELLSRIALSDGEIVSAGTFVPAAERLQLIAKLDRAVLTRVFAQVEKLMELDTIAVNISPSSINSADFSDWLFEQLSRPDLGSLRFIFEFPEFGAVQYLDILKDFSRKVQTSGHEIGLDHFGRSFSNFGYLKTLRPAYVKIDRAFTKDLEHDHEDSGFFIESLCGVAHSLDVRVIAEGVESEKQVKMFMGYNIDALQGFFLGKPEEVAAGE